MRSPLAYSPRPGPLGSSGPGAAAAYLGVLALIALVFANPIVIAAAWVAVVISGLISHAGSSLLSASRWALSLALLIVVVNGLVVRRGDTVVLRGFEVPLLGPLDVTLEALAEGTPEEALLAALRRVEPAPLSALAGETESSREELQATAEALVADGGAVALGGDVADAGTTLMTAEGFAALGERARSAVEAYHAEYPLRAGVPREELRSRLGLEERVFAPALERWVSDGVLAETGASVALAGRSPELSAAQQAEADAYVAALAASPYAPPTDRPVGLDLLAYLEEAGRVVSTGDGLVFAAEAYGEMVERVVAHLKERQTVTLAQVRDLLGTSRKYAQALLERMDQQRVTRRVGDERVLRSGLKR